MFNHNSRLTFSRFYAKLLTTKLLHIKVTQKSVLLAHVYECVAEERCKPTESLPVLSTYIVKFCMGGRFYSID